MEPLCSTSYLEPPEETLTMPAAPILKGSLEHKIVFPPDDASRRCLDFWKRGTFPYTFYTNEPSRVKHDCSLFDLPEGISQKFLIPGDDKLVIRQKTADDFGDGSNKKAIPVTVLDINRLTLENRIMLIDKAPGEERYFLTEEARSALGSHPNIAISLKEYSYRTKDSTLYKRYTLLDPAISSMYKKIHGMTQVLFYTFAGHMVKGLLHLHNHSYLHGDVSLGNFLCFNSGSNKYTVKLSDFDSLKKLSDSPYPTEQTLRYLSPRLRLRLMEKFHTCHLGSICLRYNANSAERIFCPNIQDESASIGLCLAEYFFHYKEILSKLSTRVSFLQMISDLTGGFSPSDRDRSFDDFITRIDAKLFSRKTYGELNVSLDEVAECLERISHFLSTQLS